MKLLFHLARSLSAREQHYLEQISFRYNADKDSSLFLKFLHILRHSDACPSDELCSREIYGEEPSSRYLTLKSRLRTRLVEAVAISDLEQERRIGRDVNSEIQLLYRFLVWLNIGRKLPSNPFSTGPLKQILRTAGERNYHWLSIIVIYWLKRQGQDQNNTNDLGISVQNLLHEYSTSGYMQEILFAHFHVNEGNLRVLDGLLEKKNEYFPENNHFTDPLLICARLVFEGFYWIRKGDLQSALCFFQSLESYAIKFKSTVPSHTLDMARVLLSEVYYRMHDHDLALKTLPELCQKNPSEINVRCLQLKLLLNPFSTINVNRWLENDDESLMMIMCKASACIFKNDYKNAYAILNKQFRYNPELSQWFIHLRILRVIALLGLKNQPHALRELDALRKHLYKVDGDNQREKKIIYVLRLSASQDPNENKLLNTLEQLSMEDGMLARVPLSPEIIPVHAWVREFLRYQFAMAV